MATTVTSTERIAQEKAKIGLGAGQFPSGGNGGHGNGGSGGSDRGDGAEGFSPDKARIGMWVALAAILMMFTALTSAYIIRAGLSDDWRPIKLPPLLWLSTALIVASSFSFEAARKSLKRGKELLSKRWLLLTLLLGLGFLVSQLFVWRHLVGAGVYMASNPHSSFFYVLTGVHGVHLIGGVAALSFLMFSMGRRRHEKYAEQKRQSAAGVVGLYWHFMDGLWIYLFLLLFLWR
jgi:cytochrome c oxidase subunit 3